jgi:hypothetical protein
VGATEELADEPCKVIDCCIGGDVLSPPKIPRILCPLIHATSENTCFLKTNVVNVL